jgi:hypothetical protein
MIFTKFYSDKKDVALFDKLVEDLDYDSEFGMFSEVGDIKVRSIITDAILKGWDWDVTCNALHDLSGEVGYDEAYDTEVRERVFDRLLSSSVWKENNLKKIDIM